MKKVYLVSLIACLLLLSACQPGQSTGLTGEEGQTLTIAATTWPVYCFTTAITQGVEGVQVTPVINEQMSCLHDYTLTITSMKLLEAADVVVLNGVGLEDFMSDALSTTDAQVIDASEGLTLLPLEGGGQDPHIWMDPQRAIQMLSTISKALGELDPENASQYTAHFEQAQASLDSEYQGWQQALSQLKSRAMITFHDGFGYFAQAFDLTILKAIEEEEGSEASAQEIKEITQLIQANQLPAIFTEVNGSDATAKAIARETGVSIEVLSMIMSGQGSGLAPYIEAMQGNIDALERALGETEAAA